MDTSTSALTAHRTWLTVISSNLANKDSILNEQGEYEPFQRRIAQFAPGDPTRGSASGVHVHDIQKDQAPLLPRYEPGSPYADADGYVMYPNINPVVEQMNAMLAARGYEANISVLEATKSMMTVTLEMIV